MTDIVVSLPPATWSTWVANSDNGRPGVRRLVWAFGDPVPEDDHALLYIVAHRRLRFMLSIRRVTRTMRRSLIQAVQVRPVTLPREIDETVEWRRRDFQISEELPFPAWATDGVPRIGEDAP